MNGTTYNPFTAAFVASVSTPAAGVYYSLMPWGAPPTEGNIAYEDRLGSFPGVNGMWRKRYGSRMRHIAARVIIADTTEALVETRKNALIATLEGLARFNANVPGGTVRAGCVLAQPNGFMPEYWEFFPGAFGLYGTVNLIDLSGAA